MRYRGMLTCPLKLKVKVKYGITRLCLFLCSFVSPVSRLQSLLFLSDCPYLELVYLVCRMPDSKMFFFLSLLFSQSKTPSPRNRSLIFTDPDSDLCQDCSQVPSMLQRKTVTHLPKETAFSFFSLSSDCLIRLKLDLSFWLGHERQVPALSANYLSSHQR